MTRNEQIVYPGLGKNYTSPDQKSAPRITAGTAIQTRRDFEENAQIR